MAIKHRYFYLYLALACFLGIIAIFVFDGYMGLYDSLTVNAGENEYTSDYTIERDNGPWMSGITAAWGAKAFFRYEVDNRQFTGYTADIAVSLWHNQAKVADLVTQPMSLGAFQKGKVEWSLDTTALVPGGLTTGQTYECTVIIKRGDTERRIITYIRYSSSPSKTIIIEPPLE